MDRILDCAVLQHTTQSLNESSILFQMKLILPIFAMVCTTLATLVMIVFNIAGAANASAEQIRSMKVWSNGMTLLAVVGILIGIFLIRAGQPGWAAGAAIVPTVVMVIIFLVAILK